MIVEPPVGRLRPFAAVYGVDVIVLLLALAFGFAMQAVGGLSLVLNIWPVHGAALLIAFLCLATPLYHNPFMFRGKDRDPHLYLVLVNITLAAGLLMVIGAALPA